ncbi:hypothetical protein ACFRNJ_12345 [Streptomyces sp. NPDC056721]|uniref:DUF7178 family protein n=1 Tax=Streptomyces sp. NPDC056721 TaxID=3345923 RepID=UPI0036799FB6
MIPAKPAPKDVARYVANITAAFNRATDDQAARGRQWYPVAHDLALIVGDGNARSGAGIIAALSANKSWSENVRLAKDAGTGNVHGHTGVMLAKVSAIIDGTDPADVLPMEMKTGHFFRCILDPSDPDPVVIDRHAHDVAVGERYGNRDRGLGAKGRYAALAHAYREASLRLDEIPSVVQAITWCVQIDDNTGR